MDRESWAWAAGFFDGEGHTRVDGPHSYPKINVGQNHAEPLERLRIVWGCGTVNGPYVRANGCTAYHITVSGFERVQYVIARMWPWLGTAKRDQAFAVLLKARSHPGRHGKEYNPDVCPHGHPRNEENAMWVGENKDRKICLPCHRDQGRRSYAKNKENKNEEPLGEHESL